MLDWTRLLSDCRFSQLLDRQKPADEPAAPDFAQRQFRLPQERDHDRILFSTPFRRMGDKTQVFPLEDIESIRTRLTHSYEVANLARSIGIQIAQSLPNPPSQAFRIIPATLAAAGLAHDIGNPPFGHQGEHSIRSWFKRNELELFHTKSCDTAIANDITSLTKQHRNDFLYFEGNAQTLRVLTKLQVIRDDLGLNLTLGTLASLMKYIGPSDEMDLEIQGRKKFGYFASEQPLVNELREKVGLKGDARHPLALIMEACDDIAYSVLDAEDSIKKGLVSFNDLIAWLQHNCSSNDDNVISHLCEYSLWEYENLARQNQPPGELSDIATQKFRVHAIHLMVSAIIEAFGNYRDSILCGTFDGELIGASKAKNLCKALKGFDLENAFKHREVLEIELNGDSKINRLMDFLWMGITQREEYDNVSSRRTNVFANYVYSRISRNYRRVFEGNVVEHHKSQQLPIRYREMQLLTDMVSGMTDKYCIDLHDDLAKHYREMRPINETRT